MSFVFISCESTFCDDFCDFFSFCLQKNWNFCDCTLETKRFCELKVSKLLYDITNKTKQNKNKNTIRNVRRREKLERESRKSNATVSNGYWYRACPTLVCFCCEQRKFCVLEKSAQFYLYIWDLWIKYVGIDTGGWFVVMIIREAFEITIQTYALIEYGGYNSIDNIGTQSLQLGLSDTYIILFALVLICNGVFTAVLWILYALKHNSFHGQSFEYQIFAIDAIFDTFYCLFPLISVNDHATKNYDLLTAAAALQSNSLLIFLSAVLPIIFLQRKVYVGLQNSQTKSHTKWIEKLQRSMELKLDFQEQQSNPNSGRYAADSVISRYLGDLPGMTAYDPTSLEMSPVVKPQTSLQSDMSYDGMSRKHHKTSKVRHWQGYLETLEFDRFIKRSWYSVLFTGEEFLTPSVPNMEFAFNPTIYETVSRMIEQITNIRPTLQQTKQFVEGLLDSLVFFSSIFCVGCLLNVLMLVELVLVMLS